MAERPTRIGITHAAEVLGVGEFVAAKHLRRWAHVYPKGQDGLYDARILDLIRGLRDLPHRALEPVDDDWLARYLKENHAPTAQAPRPVGTDARGRWRTIPGRARSWRRGGPPHGGEPRR